MNENKLKIAAIGVLVVIIVGGIVYSWKQSAKNSPANQAEVKKEQTLSATVPEEVSITLTNKGFEPAEVRVKKGMAVRWVNKSTLEKATVNSNDYPTNKLHPELNLGLFNKNSTLVHIFDKAGSYGYHNYFQPTQKGTVIVTE